MLFQNITIKNQIFENHFMKTKNIYKTFFYEIFAQKSPSSRVSFSYRHVRDVQNYFIKKMIFWRKYFFT